jgi:ORF6N domain
VKPSLNMTNPPITLAAIETRIQIIRGISVLLDTDLAELYGVPTKALLQAVRRNGKRFPGDFIFILTNHEVISLRSQIVTAKPGDPRGGRRPNPYAFTEQGVAMLSSVLRSPTAVQVNIEIMRAFVRLRRAALVSRELMNLIEDLSTRVDSHDTVIGANSQCKEQATERPSTATLHCAHARQRTGRPFDLRQAASH